MTDIAFAGGEVVMVGSKLKADSGTDVRDASGYIVTPGLIDLHTDVYWLQRQHCRSLRRAETLN